MTMKILYLCFLTLSANIVLLVAVLPQMNFRKCLTMDSSRRISTFASVSLNECIGECLIRVHCKSLYYRRASLLCELYSSNHGYETANSGINQPDSCVHILRHDVTTSQHPRSCYCPDKEICRPENLVCPTIEYLGCFKDDENRTLLGDARTYDRHMTVEMCLLFCTDYDYAAPQFYRHCFCGNTVDWSLQRPEDECSTVCAGNPNQMCGGRFRGSVYRVLD